jgi:hypothetical protein
MAHVKKINMEKIYWICDVLCFLRIKLFVLLNIKFLFLGTLTCAFRAQVNITLFFFRKKRPFIEDMYTHRVKPINSTSDWLATTGPNIHLYDIVNLMCMFSSFCMWCECGVDSLGLKWPNLWFPTFPIKTPSVLRKTQRAKSLDPHNKAKRLLGLP